MKLLGICASNITNDKEMNYEISQLYQEAKKVYDNIITFNPLDISINLRKNREQPEIFIKNTNLSQLETLIVRKLGDCEESTAVLVHSLMECGCYITDSLNRFQGQPPSKVLTTLKRYKANVGIDTYFAFNKANATELIKKLSINDEFPLLLKPISGKGGEGIEYLNDFEKAVQVIENLFQTNNSNEFTIMFQKYIIFDSEYRVMLFNNHCLGIAEKKQSKEIIQANAQQGGKYVAVDCPEVIEFAIKNKTQQGILGIDVARDKEDNLYILEENYAPKWEALDKVLESSVAKQIINYLTKSD